MVQSNFTKTAMDTIYNIVSGAFTLSIGNCNELSNMDFEESEVFSEMKKELIDIFFEIRNLDINLPDNLKTQKSISDKCYKIKARIADCRIQLSVLDAIIDRQRFFLLYYNTLKFEKKNPRQLSKQCERTILEDISTMLNETNGYDKAMLKSILIAYTPLRVTRGVYGDYLLNSITEMYARNKENDIGKFADFCRLYVNFEKDGVADYGELSDKIKLLSEFDGYCNNEAEILEKEHASKFDNSYRELKEDVNSAKDKLLVFLEMTNFLLIVCNYSLSFETLSEANPVANDLYYLFIENYEKNSLEEYSFRERLDECMLESVDHVNVAVDKYRKLFETQQLEKLDETEKSLAISVNTVYRIFYEHMLGIEAFINIDEHIEKYQWTSKERVRELAEETVENVLNSTADMPTRVRKLYNRFFLKHVLCTYNDREFISYIQNALENSSNSEILFTAGFIYNNVNFKKLKNKQQEINA